MLLHGVSTVTALYVHWFQHWAFLMKKCELSIKTLMSRYGVCKNVAMFKYHRPFNGMSQMLPLVLFCRAGGGTWEPVFARQVLYHWATPLPSLSFMLLECYNVQSASVRMYPQSWKHFCTNSALQEISIQFSIFLLSEQAVTADFL